MKNNFPIIEKLGGNKLVFKKLQKKGYKSTTPDSIRMWGNPNRERIPGIAMRLLMQIAQEEDVELAPGDFELTKAARSGGGE